MKKQISIKSIWQVLSLLILIACTSEQNESEQLVGTWERDDGTYKIEIKEVQAEGKLIAAYFNPAPINVGRAGWRIQNEELQIYVELQDENYQGSMYQLTFDDQTGKLVGTYYQAVSGQTYEVNFSQTKN